MSIILPTVYNYGDNYDIDNVKYNPITNKSTYPSEYDSNFASSCINITFPVNT